MEPFRLPQDVVDFVVSLVFNPGQFQMKDIINLIAKKLFIELKTIQTEPDSFAHLEKLELAFPLIFQAAYALILGNQEESKSLLVRFNEAARDAEIKSKEKSRDRLPAEQLDVVEHSVPVYYYKQLELMKVQIA